jgi:hypothetical protein
MTDCRKCENRIFDDQAGKYRCTRFNHNLHDIYKYVECQGYKKKRGDVDERETERLHE